MEENTVGLTFLDPSLIWETHAFRVTNLRKADDCLISPVGGNAFRLTFLSRTQSGWTLVHLPDCQGIVSSMREEFPPGFQRMVIGNMILAIQGRGRERAADCLICPMDENAVGLTFLDPSLIWETHALWVANLRRVDDCLISPVGGNAIRLTSLSRTQSWWTRVHLSGCQGIVSSRREEVPLCRQGMVAGNMMLTIQGRGRERAADCLISSMEENTVGLTFLDPGLIWETHAFRVTNLRKADDCSISSVGGNAFRLTFLSQTQSGWTRVHLPDCQGIASSRREEVPVCCQGMVAGNMRIAVQGRGREREADCLISPTGENTVGLTFPDLALIWETHAVRVAI